MGEEIKRLIKATVSDEVEKILYIADCDLEKNQQKILADLSSEVISILEKAIQLQEENMMGEIGAITFVLSRLNISGGIHTYPVLFFGEKLYVDFYEHEFESNVSFLYKYIDECKEICRLELKKYANFEITVCEVEQELYQHLKYFNMYLVTLLRKIFEEAAVLNRISQLKTCDTFLILQNELYEKPYCLYEKKGRVEVC